MEWFVDPLDQRAASSLRRQIGAYLRRHAENPVQVDEAELAVDELIVNAVSHSYGPVWISLDWSQLEPVLSIYDLGEDFDAKTDLPDDELAESGRGLFLAAHLTRHLKKAHRRGGGNKVTATLNVERGDEVASYSPQQTDESLPSIGEATNDGVFGKETFLRALVVQLSQSIEMLQGPGAAEAAVTQVGTDVGGQMEAAYRKAERIVGAMTPTQIADCLVRLKAAIDGDFYVIEANEHKIVLGNRRCPFGPVVQRGPALCRMTSSVFGGISSRNTGGATVVLEERIAVGDPECRVVVHLGAKQRPDVGHYYAAAPAG